MNSKIFKLVLPFLVKLVPAFLISIILISSIYALDQKQNKNSTGWKQLPQILKNIKKPVFPDKDFTVRITNSADMNSDARPAIQELIDKCSVSGGGRVIIPKGNYFVKGPINLKNDVNLYLEEVP